MGVWNHIINDLRISREFAHEFRRFFVPHENVTAVPAGGYVFVAAVPVEDGSPAQIDGPLHMLDFGGHCEERRLDLLDLVPHGARGVDDQSDIDGHPVMQRWETP